MLPMNYIPKAQQTPYIIGTDGSAISIYGKYVKLSIQSKMLELLIMFF